MIGLTGRVSLWGLAPAGTAKLFTNQKRLPAKFSSPKTNKETGESRNPRHSLTQLCVVCSSSVTAESWPMETSKPQSFFQDIRSRELHGFRGSLFTSISRSLNFQSHSLPYNFSFSVSVPKKQSYINCLTSDFSETGAIAAEHNGPPMAISFGKVQNQFRLRVFESCFQFLPFF